jgi:hypothetical protein
MRREITAQLMQFSNTGALRIAARGDLKQTFYQPSPTSSRHSLRQDAPPLLEHLRQQL